MNERDVTLRLFGYGLGLAYALFFLWFILRAAIMGFDAIYWRFNDIGEGWPEIGLTLVVVVYLMFLIVREGTK